MQQEPARVYRSPPSAIRGWLRRIGGFLTLNRHARLSGTHEIQDARTYRNYERDQRRQNRSHSRHRNEYEVDRRERRHHPFLHPSHRCRPPYHGAHLRLWGFLTRRKEHMTRGLTMADEAERERMRERRRRQRRLEAEGLAIRMGARTVMRGEHSSRSRSRSHRHQNHSSRSRSHRHHRDGFTPIVLTADVGHGATYPVTVNGVPVTAGATTQAIPVARSVSAHHRHHSSNGTAVPLVRASSSRHGHGYERHRTHSRSYSGGTTTPVVQVANSQYTNGAGAVAPAPVNVTMSRGASSRHGYGRRSSDERALPVVRSSSRHGSTRYGDLDPIPRAASSRYAHGYVNSRSQYPSRSRHGSHGQHNRMPSQVYVSA